MNWKFLPVLLFVMMCTGQVDAQQSEYNALVNNYIQKYSDIAIREMAEYHIPASITLAQGILESNAGRSDLALEANNHFGIKCHKEWTGKTFFKDDDAKNECFRKYENPFESFRDHSYFLTRRDRYKGLFLLDIKDYKGWATGLKSAGYATNPVYAQLLIKTIETYFLDRFDNMTYTEARSDTTDGQDVSVWLKKFSVIGKASGNRTMYENNGLRLIIAGPDDNLYVIARDCNISVDKLLKYNDLAKATALQPGQIVYLDHKRRKGSAPAHKVQSGETLYTLSQVYGIRIKMIYKRNGEIRKGAEPRPGTVLRLR
jgi:hypothetical protein